MGEELRPIIPNCNHLSLLSCPLFENLEFRQLKIRSKILQEKLRDNLFEIFGAFDNAAFEEVTTFFRWREILAGEWLFRQNDPGDSLYMLINGRLQVLLEEGQYHSVIGDVSRGETVGEMAIFTGEDRSASVRAVRDSVLVQLDKGDFNSMIQRFPGLGINITKLIIERLKRKNLMQRYTPRYVGIAVLAISDSIDHRSFCTKLYNALTRRNKSVLLLTLDKVRQMIGRTDLYAEGTERRDDNLDLSQWLDEQEALHDFVLYVTDRKEVKWTRKCLRHADEVLLVANDSEDAQISSAEKLFLHSGDRQVMANLTLILFHPSVENGSAPRRTDQWLRDRSVNAHRHLQNRSPKEFDRLARFICGETNGLVLSGGGAKGIAHLGIYRALEELDVPFDLVGGTSIGAVFGGLIARGMDAKEVRNITRKMFLSNPTPLSDYNFLPMVSLLKGKTLDGMLAQVFRDIKIEDLWRDFFCVASNLSKVQPVVFDSGSLQKAIRASLSIPAVFPPVVHGNSLLIDGGVFNNFPIDLMAERGAGNIVGIFLNQEKEKELNYDKVPGTWDLLIDRYRRDKRRYHLPSMVTSIVQSTTLNSNKRSQEQLENVDLLFCPDLTSFSLLAWNKFDKIEEVGYRHAQEVLENWQGF